MKHDTQPVGSPAVTAPATPTKRTTIPGPRSHWPEYAAEALGTAVLLFCVVTAVSWLFSPRSPVPALIPSLYARLFITGFLLGGVGAGISLTPPGRLSGAHLNPALSLGFWAMGKMHGRDLLGFIAGQSVGATVGTALGVLAWHGLAGPVHDAITLPGPGVGALWTLGGEVGASFVLSEAIFIMVSSKRTMNWTPVAVVMAVTVLVGIDGNFSGASMNPVRSLAPAAFAAVWSWQWAYIVGPPLGMILAGLVHRYATPLETRTSKIFHDAHYRSIFKHTKEPHQPTHVLHGDAAPTKGVSSSLPG